MARTSVFDRDLVVQNARAVFWAKGYETASIPELEKATGLSRSSIYNSFGSKRGLFDAAVNSYLDEIIRPRLQPLLQDPVAPDALADYLQGLGAAFAKPDSLPSTNGCLLINTASAPIAAESDIAEVVTNYRNELHDALSHGLRASRPDLSAEQQALLSDTITGLVVAAFAMVRIAPKEATRLLQCALSFTKE